MVEKFKNKYRIQSARASWWDYSNEGLYFITICTVGRECLLGKIESGEMFLSDLGKIVKEEWEKSFEIRSELICDKYVIMPNHIHAIIEIKKDSYVDPHGSAANKNESNLVKPQGLAALSKKNGIAHRPPKSISSFVAGFKSAATIKINKYRNKPKLPVWQTRFHDRIIRDFDEYHGIQNYIIENPEKWINDKFFIE